MKTARGFSLTSSLLAIAILVMPVTMAGEGKGKSPLVPPQAKFRGKSLEEWSVLWGEWQIATGLGGATDLNDTVKKVRFLPTVFTPGEYEFDVAMRPGTGFTFPAFFVFGERYDDPNVPDDNPADPILAFIFETTHVETRLNGKVLLQGFASELADYGFGPVYFDEPIVYVDPQPRGPNLNSVAALFIMGIGSVYHPLPPGEHVLETTIDSLFFGSFHITHHITVAP